MSIVKNLFVVLGLVLIAGLGYYLYTTNESFSLKGSETDINLEAESTDLIRKIAEINHRFCGAPVYNHLPFIIRWDWTYTGVAWGNATSRYNTPEGQGAKIEFTDGVTNRFTRLERPHLIFQTNQMKGDPVYLINSAQYGNGTNPGSASLNDDACYTLVRPINQR